MCFFFYWIDGYLITTGAAFTQVLIAIERWITLWWLLDGVRLPIRTFLTGSYAIRGAEVGESTAIFICNEVSISVRLNLIRTTRLSSSPSNQVLRLSLNHLIYALFSFFESLIWFNSLNLLFKVCCHVELTSLICIILYFCRIGYQLI